MIKYIFFFFQCIFNCFFLFLIQNKILRVKNHKICLFLFFFFTYSDDIILWTCSNLYASLCFWENSSSSSVTVNCSLYFTAYVYSSWRAQFVLNSVVCSWKEWKKKLIQWLEQCKGLPRFFNSSQTHRTPKGYSQIF